MARPRKPVNDLTLETWLSDFRNQTTKRVYLAALRAYKQCLSITDFGDYLKGGPDVNQDLKKFLVCLDGKPPKTVNGYVMAVKLFFADHDMDIDQNGWKKLRRRGYVPKRVIPLTRDKKNTKQELKRILNHLSVKGRALVLFLASSGCRLGETLRLRVDDLELDTDPPRAYIRGENMKSGVGERTVFFSYEARDAVKDWLQVKDKIGKRDGKGTYKSMLVWPFSTATAHLMWSTAVDKAGLGVKDQRTQRRIYHLHGLRKFFRSNIGLDLDITNALMGHVEYLDQSYLRLEQEAIAKAYKTAMNNVSVYEGPSQEVEDLQRENTLLKERIQSLENKQNEIERRFQIALAIKDKSDSLVEAVKDHPKFRELVFEVLSEGPHQVREDTYNLKGETTRVKIHPVTKKDAEGASAAREQPE